MNRECDGWCGGKKAVYVIAAVGDHDALLEYASCEECVASILKAYMSVVRNNECCSHLRVKPV